MSDGLAVWMDGAIVAEITRLRGRMRLRYTDEALGRYALGYPLLSMSLPLTDGVHPHGRVRAFLDGLLPEGDARQTLARRHGLQWDDSYGLIAALGRDCAGAIVIQPIADPPPPTPTTLGGRALSDSEVAELIRNLRVAPLGAGGSVRISLGGVQEKLVLTRLPDGRWAQPADGTPSTHILKPAISRFEATIQNEAFCMRVAQNLGLRAAKAEVTRIAGIDLLVVERFDREVEKDGTVKRLHQEDFCQALGLLPSQKYEEDGGPSLRRVSEILLAVTPTTDLEALLKAVTLNVMLGNCDAHAKNFSLLHGPSGRLGLAPLYDLMCTAFYGEERLAMYIDSLQRLDRVAAPRIINEAEKWGLMRNRATEVIREVVEAAGRAIDASAGETDSVPDAIVEFAHRQAETLRQSLSY